jgi:hypothetical protein
VVRGRENRRCARTVNPLASGWSERPC